jgi:hypothetical protein
MVCSNILGVHNMASGLKHIALILSELVEELKADNDRWEKANESATVSRPSDDGKTNTRGDNNERLH